MSSTYITMNPEPLKPRDKPMKGNEELDSSTVN